MVLVISQHIKKQKCFLAKGRHFCFYLFSQLNLSIFIVDFFVYTVGFILFLWNESLVREKFQLL